MGMVNYNQKSQFVTVFHAFPALEEGATLAGYAALIEGHEIIVDSHNMENVLDSFKKYLFLVGTERCYLENHRYRVGASYSALPLNNSIKILSVKYSLIEI